MSATYEDLGLTNFPDSIDTFLTYLNITATDAPLIAQYQSAVESGDFTTAQTVLAQIPSYTQKLIKATDLNKIMQSILALERFYKSDIQSYVAQKQTEWEAIVGDFDYVGNYSSGTTYATNNVVSYTAGGLTLLYIAIGNPPVGTVPTNTTYWRVLTIRGQQGPSGEGLSYRGNWDNAQQYNINNCVTFDNILWGATASNINAQPSMDSQYWEAILQLASTIYPVQSDEPADQQVGELWFNTTGEIAGLNILNPLSNPAEANQIINNYQAYNDAGTLVVGTYEPPTLASLTADATATPETVLSGTIAYSKGEKIVGTYELPQLSTPATAQDIAVGTQAINAQGQLIEGMLQGAVRLGDVVYTNGQYGSDYYYFGYTTYVTIPEGISWKKGDIIIAESNGGSPGFVAVGVCTTAPTGSSAGTIRFLCWVDNGTSTSFQFFGNKCTWGFYRFNFNFSSLQA